MVICLERGADLHMAQLMPLPLTVSCFSKIQIGFTFLVLVHLGSPRKGPLNGCVCVCCYCMYCIQCIDTADWAADRKYGFYKTYFSHSQGFFFKEIWSILELLQKRVLVEQKPSVVFRRVVCIYK